MEAEVITSVGRVMNHENIAIGVLMITAVAEGFLIFYLLKHLFAVKDVLLKVNSAITKLNQRLNNHD